jgi:hypothetical protein
MKANPTVSHQDISRRAHRIWEQAGQPDGCETEHWLRAERELHASGTQKIASHSTNYVHPGVSNDAVHHRRH